MNRESKVKRVGKEKRINKLIDSIEPQTIVTNHSTKLISTIFQNMYKKHNLLAVVFLSNSLDFLCFLFESDVKKIQQHQQQTKVMNQCETKKTQMTGNGNLMVNEIPKLEVIFGQPAPAAIMIKPIQLITQPALSAVVIK